MIIKELIHILIPKIIMEFHPNVNLLADYLYVQSIPLLHSMARKYQFRTIKTVKTGRTPKTKEGD